MSRYTIGNATLHLDGQVYRVVGDLPPPTECIAIPTTIKCRIVDDGLEFPTISQVERWYRNVLHLEWRRQRRIERGKPRKMRGVA